MIQLPIGLISDGQRNLQISGSTLERTLDGPGRMLDRMGNPVVNTVFIPSSLKDEYNRSLPADDAENFADVILAKLDDFGTSQENVNTLASVAVPDTLKLNLDAAGGFPNGRRLQDDVIDTLLSLVLNGPASDGVDRNDRAFSNTFPYLAPPHQAR